MPGATVVLRLAPPTCLLLCAVTYSLNLSASGSGSFLLGSLHPTPVIARSTGLPLLLPLLLRSLVLLRSLCPWCLSSVLLSLLPLFRPERVSLSPFSLSVLSLRLALPCWLVAWVTLSSSPCAPWLLPPRPPACALLLPPLVARLALSLLLLRDCWRGRWQAGVRGASASCWWLWAVGVSSDVGGVVAACLLCA